MNANAELLPIAWLRALRDPVSARSWTLSDWERVLRLARRLRLLGRLAESVCAAGVDQTLPAPVQQHLLAEQRHSRHRLRIMCWTVERVGEVLAGAGYPCVLLKGAAYVAQGLPVAPGRLPSDVDIMVPRERLGDAQRLLVNNEWAEVQLDAHDQQYYHDWSHEVPPMHHLQFGMELDLHHNILPPVARTTVNASLLLARVQPSGLPVWRVLCPVDQVLHSAAHLFLDSELRDRLRDLVDLDGLMSHFAQRPGFWTELLERSVELGLVEPLALACHYTRAWLGTAVPPDVRRTLDTLGPGPARKAWLLPLFDAVLWPTDPDARDSWPQTAAATVLLGRYHLQRMPLRLLLPHLWHKSRSRRRRSDDGDDGF